MSNVLFYQEIKEGDLCPECKRFLITMAKNGEVYCVCLVCGYEKKVGSKIKKGVVSK